jgi:O-antigen/teichoic acid export membrane protein
MEVRRLSATSDAKQVLRAARILCFLALPLSIGAAIALGQTIFLELHPDTRMVAIVGVSLSPLMMSWSCDVSVLVANERYRGVMVMQLAQPGIYVVMVIALSLLGVASPATVLIASLCGTTTTFMVGIFLTRTSLWGPHVPLGSLMKNAIRFAGSSIAEAASSRLDQVLVLPLIGSFQSGIYSVAVTVAAVPLSLGQALGASFFRPIARAEGTVRRDLQAAAVRSASALALMSIPVMAIAIQFGLPVLFGEQYATSVPIAFVSLLGTAGMMTAYVCSMALGAAGRGTIMSIAQISSLILGTVLLYVLGPIYGAVGAAVASSIAYFTLLAILVCALRIPFVMLIPRSRDYADSVRRLFGDR